MASKEQMLRKLLSNIANEQNYKDAIIKIETKSIKGFGYTSLHYNATISAPNVKELQLFAKVANLDEEARKFCPTSIFDVERFLYLELAETFKKIEQKAEVPEEHKYIFPKVYGFNDKLYEETLVLANLAAEGYAVYDRLKSIDWPYASKVVETLTKFHALSMAYEEQRPEEYHKIVKKLNEQIDPAYKSVSDNFKDFMTTALSATREENKERLQKYFDDITSTDDNVFRFTKPKRKAVLMHRDLIPVNIMHKFNKDGMLDIILLDYQAVSGGCGVADLLIFIFGASDAEFRAKYYQRLVDHYYDSLALALTRLRLDPKKIYPREDFDYDLAETLPYGLISAVMVLPTLTIDPQHVPDFNADSTQSLAKPITSPLYPVRLNGVIDDYIRWGVL